MPTELEDTMHRIASIASTFALFAGLTFSAGAEARTVVVVHNAPPPRVEVVGVRPHPEAVWVPGHWDRSGWAWVWRPGHWKQANLVYFPGHYEIRGHHQVWIPATWR
jgi:hypothetical protein